ncbi:Site-specific recombinase XerD [Streptomyces sp. DvalAA-14]|uniref:tyrosine-type recombinase/integrase n=1 Tax=unclassified Streptomyces TaxID=2593676 RepID=UPI00081BBAAB|nr:MULTISPECIES: tyrosine-type recombinase/integrase [unclassified Streptomyces]MYS24683.1 tyrosine-type recombinase/integrase [Streptomyces sp. SID4948]SCE48384.1 Site-specific recombinase XerD [Streptomyces sp. DvalAA-14]
MAKRRANGEGTITKRADGRYQAAAYVFRPDGTRVRKFAYGKTRAEVAEKLTAMQEQTRQGIPAATSAMCLTDFLTYWLVAVAAVRLKPSTLMSYEVMSRVYIEPKLGRKKLNRLSPADIRLFLAEFKNGCLCCLRGLDSDRPEEDRTCCAVGKCCKRRPSARTVQYAHSVLRSALQQAVREELITRNVARIVETPTVPREEVRPLDRTEAKMLLKTAKGHRLYALWLLLVSTGLRRGEVLALTWDDIDLDRGQLRVRRNLQRIKKELLFGTPKTARSLRTISLPQGCVTALKAHRTTHQAERAAAGQHWTPLASQPAGLVFTTSTGRPTDPRSLNRMLTVLCREAKVRQVRVHDLRHTCASLLLAQGVDARTIMETLGHSTITMTLDTYAHVMDSTLRKAADRMDDALSLDDGEEGDDGAAGVPARV